jgi:hypothetical protein
MAGNDHFNRSAYPYSQSECFKLCRHQKGFQICNKSQEYEKNFQYYFTNRGLWKQALNAAYYDCIRSNYTHFVDFHEKFEKYGEAKYCLSKCPIECKRLSYSIKTYYKQMHQKFSIVNIYYEDFTYLSISEIPKVNIYSLLGLIGGISSLFMGMSLISCLKLIEMLAKLFVIFCKHFINFLRFLISSKH